MTRIPASALLLGLAGLIPFVWAALLVIGVADPGLTAPFAGWVALSGDGILMMVRYGTIILCFMSGVLWGFATKARGARAAVGYALSVVPALWVFLFPGAGATSALINLMTGFAGLLILDFAFTRWRLAPAWWMSLRVLLTAIVLVCLGIGAFA